LFSASDLIAQTYHSASQSGVTPMAYHYEKPLLVTAVDGLSDPIINDNTGIVVHKNSKSIAEGILNLVDENKRKECIKNIQKVIPQYHWKTFVNKWEAFILKEN
jgi:D-inositol-3-phosphate glycosyltransferase